jgi:hypothetical protein
MKFLSHATLTRGKGGEGGFGTLAKRKQKMKQFGKLNFIVEYVSGCVSAACTSDVIL